VKKAAAALTLGRRCSHGRLGEDGRRGVVLHDVNVPALLLPPCVDILVWSLLSSDSLVTVGAPVSSARHGRRAPSSSSPSLPPSPPLPPLGCGTEDWGKPQVVGGKPASARVRGCRRPVKTARGKDAAELEDWMRRQGERCGRTSMASGAPDVVAPGAIESFPLGGFPRQDRARCGSASGPAERCGRPIRRAHGRGRVRTRQRGKGKR
jgi:hypothetical protein